MKNENENNKKLSLPLSILIMMIYPQLLIAIKYDLCGGPP